MRKHEQESIDTNLTEMIEVLIETILWYPQAKEVYKNYIEQMKGGNKIVVTKISKIVRISLRQERTKKERKMPLKRNGEWANRQNGRKLQYYL